MAEHSHTTGHEAAGRLTRPVERRPGGTRGGAAEGAAHGTAHTGHPTPLTYFKVAMTLTTLTAMEVGVFYITALGHGIIPILVILSGTKFALVVMFYMHLRYDARLFSSFFVGGLALALLIAVAVLGLFKWFI